MSNPCCSLAVWSFWGSCPIRVSQCGLPKQSVDHMRSVAQLIIHQFDGLKAMLKYRGWSNMPTRSPMTDDYDSLWQWLTVDHTDTYRLLTCIGVGVGHCDVEINTHDSYFRLPVLHYIAILAASLSDLLPDKPGLVFIIVVPHRESIRLQWCLFTAPPALLHLRLAMWLWKLG